jgi:integrase/recombinase XerD
MPKGCRPFTPDEVEDMLSAFRGKFRIRDRALFLLGIKSGFRISELLSLRVGDVYNGDRIIDRVYVQRASMKKQVEGRNVILHPEAKEAIVQLIKADRLEGVQECPEWLFCSRKGASKPLSRSSAWRILKTAAKRAGLDGVIGTHSMRKTFADRMYDLLGRDLIKTQTALGHKNINSTVQYLGFKQEDIDSAILKA